MDVNSKDAFHTDWGSGRHISIDLETYSSVPIAKAGLYKYVQSPDFEILLFAYSVDGSEVGIIDLAQGEPFPQWMFDLLKSPEYIKHAYNAAFEWYCLSKYCGSLLPADQWRDTQLHSLYCGYPPSLEKAGKALGLPSEKQKLAIGKSLIRYFCIPCTPTKTNGERTRNLPKHDPEKWRLFKTYCKGDVTTEMEIEKRLSAFPVPYDVEKQWQTDLKINARGVSVDMEMVRGAIEIGDTARQKLIDEAVAITGLNNPNSVQQLLAWLEQETNEDITDLRKETVAYMLNKQTVTGSAERILEIRQELGKTSTKKYDAINTAVCSDRRVRGLLQFYGANRTGRWAGRLVQVQNLPRTYIGQLPFARKAVSERKPEKLRVMYGSVPDTLSQLIRTSFVASKGNTLVDADFSAIEARVIAWLAKEQWKLEVFRTHGKIYEASASQMFGVPIERIKKGNPEYALRQRGKVAELALGYQGGVPAMRKMDAGHQLDDLSDDEVKEIVTRWRETNKRIVDLWYSVENAAVSVIQTGKQTGVNGLLFTREFDVNNDLDFMTITLPSKRKLFYAKPKLGVNQWGKPSIIYHGINQQNKQWSELETYGGKLVENVIQAIARDCLSTAIEHLEEAGFPIVFHIHDEVVIDCPTEKADLDAVIKIMTQPIPWAPDLPLNADGWVGDYFRKD